MLVIKIKIVYRLQVTLKSTSYKRNSIHDNSKGNTHHTNCQNYKNIIAYLSLQIVLFYYKNIQATDAVQTNKFKWGLYPTTYHNVVVHSKIVYCKFHIEQ